MLPILMDIIAEETESVRHSSIFFSLKDVYPDGIVFARK